MPQGLCETCGMEASHVVHWMTDLRAYHEYYINEKESENADLVEVPVSTGLKSGHITQGGASLGATPKSVT